MPLPDDLAVELRCPAGHKLGVVRAPRIVDGNLIEIDCRACRRTDYPGSAQVLHQFNVEGEVVDTIVVERRSTPVPR